jgi:hypothetical protein
VRESDKVTDKAADKAALSLEKKRQNQPTQRLLFSSEGDQEPTEQATKQQTKRPHLLREKNGFS